MAPLVTFLQETGWADVTVKQIINLGKVAKVAKVAKEELKKLKKKSHSILHFVWQASFVTQIVVNEGSALVCGFFIDWMVFLYSNWMHWFFQQCSGMSYSLDNVGVSRVVVLHFTWQHVQWEQVIVANFSLQFLSEVWMEERSSLSPAQAILSLAPMCTIQEFSTTLMPITTSSLTILLALAVEHFGYLKVSWLGPGLDVFFQWDPVFRTGYFLFFYWLHQQQQTAKLYFAHFPLWWTKPLKELIHWLIIVPVDTF